MWRVCECIYGQRAADEDVRNGAAGEAELSEWSGRKDFLMCASPPYSSEQLRLRRKAFRALMRGHALKLRAYNCGSPTTRTRQMRKRLFDAAVQYRLLSQDVTVEMHLALEKAKSS